MNEWEQCISEWADRCNERDKEITILRQQLALEKSIVKSLEDGRDRNCRDLNRLQEQLEQTQRVLHECHKKWDAQEHYPKGYVNAQVQLRERVEAQLAIAQARIKKLEEYEFMYKGLEK